jgi:uncharacterized RDD family membrane protein YckC
MGAPLIKPKMQVTVPEQTVTNPGSRPSVVTQVTQSGLKLYHNQSEDLDQYEAATFGQRAFAIFIDSFFLGIVSRMMNFLLKGLMVYLTARSPVGGAAMSFAVQTVLSFYILAWPLTEWGCTAGKKVMGLRVVNTKSHGDITLWQAFNREIFGKGLSSLLLGIGYLQVLTRPDRLALHDRLCHTRVIRYKKAA